MLHGVHVTPSNGDDHFVNFFLDLRYFKFHVSLSLIESKEGMFKHHLLVRGFCLFRA